MAINIASGIQHTPPTDGFSQYPYQGFNFSSDGTSVAGTVVSAATNYEVRGNTTYLNSRTETATLLVAALRPTPSAALHTVGSDFMAITVSNLTKANIKRFF